MPQHFLLCNVRMRKWQLKLRSVKIHKIQKNCKKDTRPISKCPSADSLTLPSQMGFVGFWCDLIHPQFIWCRIWHYFFLFGTVLTKICSLQAHLDTLTESIPHFRLSYPNWNNHHVVFSRYGENNWCLGRIFVYHVDSAFQGEIRS